MRKYIILIFIISFVSCEKKEEKIESIKVWYYNGIFERVTAVDCDEVVYLPEKVDTIEVVLEDGSILPKEAVVLESKITDKENLREIAVELQKRKNITHDYVDARMKCYIIRESGQVDSLCIGDNPIYALYNNQPIKLSNKLIYLIRDYCGFYRWINAGMLQYFDELNDPTFEREKVISRSGERY